MMHDNPKILIAGATGYLGQHLVQALQSQGSNFVALARNLEKLHNMGLKSSQIRQADVTDPASLQDCCKDIDLIISCVGITRQKDGLTYMDVDYQANINLLEQAEKSGVKAFIYISAFNAKKFQAVRMLYAKEQFSQRLLGSEVLEPLVIRPNGFYSDIDALFEMAKSGKAYLFGPNDIRLNPIHGDDLAQFCLASIGPMLKKESARELDVGGPEIFSMTQISQLAFQALNKSEKIIYLPDWVRKVSLALVKRLPESIGGAAEFFLTVTEQDMIAPAYGKHQLLTHFKSKS